MMIDFMYNIRIREYSSNVNMLYRYDIIIVVKCVKTLLGK